MSTPITRGFIHWSVTGPKTTVADLRRMHVEGNGWRDIGYHWVILHPDSNELKGQAITGWWQIVKRGRPINDDKVMTAAEQGAHAFGHNKGTLSCVVVQKPGDKLHPLQIQALEAVMATWCKRYGLAPTDMYGHRDVNATQCPGDELYGLVKAFRDGRKLSHGYDKRDLEKAALEFALAMEAYLPVKEQPEAKQTSEYRNKMSAWERFLTIKGLVE